jgi:hypothetical protein
MRPGYCVSTTTNGAWQLAHCEQRIVGRQPIALLTDSARS